MKIKAYGVKSFEIYAVSYNFYEHKLYFKHVQQIYKYVHKKI